MISVTTNAPCTRPRRMNDDKVREFRELLRLAGLRPEYTDRGFHSGVLAVLNGDRPVAVAEVLTRTRPEMFSDRLRTSAKYNGSASGEASSTEGRGRR